MKMADDFHCSICGTSASPSQSIPYPNAGLELHPQKIVFCSKCEAGHSFPNIDESLLDSYYSKNPSAWEGEAQTMRDMPIHLSLGASRWDWIRRPLSPEEEPLSILDIGAGNAGFGMAVSLRHKKNIQYFAQDLDQRVLNKLKSYWPKQEGVQLNLVKNLSELNEPVELLVLSHVLEHMQNPADFLKLHLSKVRPNGLVFVEVPNQDFRFKKNLFPHLTFFNETSLKALFETCGIKPIQSGIFGGPLQKSVFSPKFPKHKKYLERTILRFRNWLPESFLIPFFRWQQATDLTSADGPWVRILGRKSHS